MPFSAARGDEAAHEVRADGPRADEEAAAQRDAERRRRPCLQRPDPLPRALDAAPHRRVEDAAAGDLEAGEAGARRGPRRAASSSAVGTRPASGSCESRRIVVSTSAARAGAYPRAVAAVPTPTIAASRVSAAASIAVWSTGGTGADERASGTGRRAAGAPPSAAACG